MNILILSFGGPTGLTGDKNSPDVPDQAMEDALHAHLR